MLTNKSISFSSGLKLAVLHSVNEAVYAGSIVCMAYSLDDLVAMKSGPIKHWLAAGRNIYLCFPSTLNYHPSDCESITWQQLNNVQYRVI
jgi:hypothetical protein